MKFFLMACAVVMSSFSGVAAEFPLISDFGPVENYGQPLRRSMGLMDESSASSPRRVKVLFYGQSITEQSWSWNLANDLRQRFPNADLVISNRAISGFTVEVLVKTAETDLYTFYPDLLIFQVYGATNNYEEVISRLRSRTTADILIQTDHPTLPEEITEPTDPSAIPTETSQAYRNYVFLPELAARYDCELADVRTYWKRYLLRNGLAPSDLLSDHIHLNDHGNYLMGELVKSHLRTPGRFSPPDLSEAVTTFPVPPVNNDICTMEFFGNRVDLVAGSAFEGLGPIEILIDGRPPSQIPEIYAFTRATLYPASVWPCVMDIGSHAPLLDEKWTLKVKHFGTNPVEMTFSLEGSKTGPDGEGSTTADFVSNSKRVVIDAANWWLVQPAASRGPLSPGFEIQWEARMLGADEFSPTAGDGIHEQASTVAQGLANGKHILTLRGPAIRNLSAIRIYNPLARVQPPRAREDLRIEKVEFIGDQIQFRIHSSGRYLIEQRSSLSSPWQPLTAPTTDLLVRLPLDPQHHFFRARGID